MPNITYKPGEVMADLAQAFERAAAFEKCLRKVRELLNQVSYGESNHDMQMEAAQLLGDLPQPKD